MMMKNNNIELGDEVKDDITGFKGKAVSITKYIFGCERIEVQPKVRKDGTLPESQGFDVGQLLLVKPKNVPKVNQDKGGPRPMTRKPQMVKHR